MDHSKPHGPAIDTHFYKQGLATVATCLFSISSGLTFGITTVMLPQLKQDESFPYDQYYDSWIASIATLSMIISCPITGTILDKFGRRLSHIIFNIPFLIGWFCITIANNNTLVLIGRFMTGISNGATRPITLVYIVEIADPKHRSTFLIVSGLCIHVGVFISHVIGQYFYWKTSTALCLIQAVISTIAFIYLKESPQWLISKGRIDEGVEAFNWFRGEGDEAKIELDSIVERQKQTPEKMTMKELKDFVQCRSFLKVVTALIFLTLVIPACGVNSISFYAIDIYDKTFLGKLDAYMLVLAIDCVRTFQSIVICMFGNYLQKKKMTFIACCIGVTLSLFFLCIFLYINCDKLRWVIVTLIILYTGFGSAIVTIGWTFMPEILPINVRSIGSALASCTSYGFIFATVKMLPYILDMYGMLTMYLIFAIVTLVSTIVLWCLLPETSGKTLQAIENSFTKNNESITKL